MFQIRKFWAFRILVSQEVRIRIIRSSSKNCDFLSLKERCIVYVPSKINKQKNWEKYYFLLASWSVVTDKKNRIRVGSVSQMYGSADPDPYSADPDPYQNVTDQNTVWSNTPLFVTKTNLLGFILCKICRREINNYIANST